MRCWISSCGWHLCESIVLPYRIHARFAPVLVARSTSLVFTTWSREERLKLDGVGRYTATAI